VKIVFKDGTKKECYNPIESMLFKNTERAAWLFSFNMNVNSAEAERILTQENISKIRLENVDGTQGYLSCGYDMVNSVSIEYSDCGAVTTVQLKRGIKNDEGI